MSVNKCLVPYVDYIAVQPYKNIVYCYFLNQHVNLSRIEGMSIYLLKLYVLFCNLFTITYYFLHNLFYKLFTNVYRPV